MEKCQNCGDQEFSHEISQKTRNDLRAFSWLYLSQNNRIKKKRAEMSVISLFSGCGGLDFGIEPAGWNIGIRNDVDIHSCNILRTNCEEDVLCAPIEEVLSEDIRKSVGYGKNAVDLAIGGPPCQPFSKSAYWSSGDTRRGKLPLAYRKKVSLAIVRLADTLLELSSKTGKKSPILDNSGPAGLRSGTVPLGKQKTVLERNGGHPNVSQIIPNRFAPRRDPTANRQCSTFLDCRKTWKSIVGTNAFREIPKAPLSRSQKGGFHPAARRCRTGSRRVPAFCRQACCPSWNRQGKVVSKKNQQMQ